MEGLVGPRAFGATAPLRRARRWIAAMGLAGLLAACGIAQQAERREALQKATAASSAAKADCERRFTPVRRGQVANWANCLNEAERLLLPFYPYPDLLELKFASRASLGAKLDRGQISEEDAQLEAARLSSQLTAELDRRRQARRAVEAQETMAAAAYRSSLGFTCTRLGYAMVCN